MVELARLRARDEPGPVHRDALQRRRRVEGAALLEAQCAAVALGDLARSVDDSAPARALLDQVEGACKEDASRLLSWVFRDVEATAGVPRAHRTM